MVRLLKNRKWRLALAALVCVASVALLASRLHYGFLPQDDPAFSNFADRTLHGELPNVDFYDDYTGGLSYLNALALRIFGLRLISLRIMLLLIFVPWIATIWYLAFRVTSPLNAAVATLMAAVWSVPVYPCPFATWYNLYFATFGTAALFRYLDTGHRRWIFWTGVCGGLSCLAKIFGLYFLAAVVFVLVFDEQAQNAKRGPQPKANTSAYSICLTAALLAFLLALTKLINSAGHSAGWLASCYHFVLPGASLSLFLIYREWGTPRVAAHTRFMNLGARMGFFGTGVIIPIAIFLTPYIQRHAVSKWYAGVLLSAGRMRRLALPPKTNLFALLCLPLLLILLVNAECKGLKTRKAAVLILFTVLGSLLLAVPDHLLLSAQVWFSVAESLPILVLIGVLLLSRKGLDRSSLTGRLTVLLCVAATFGLVQFPYAAPMYFCFVVPILILLLLAIAEETTAHPQGDSLLLPVLV